MVLMNRYFCVSFLAGLATNVNWAENLPNVKTLDLKPFSPAAI